MRLFERFRNISILLLTHANGLILLGQWNSIRLITLLKQIVYLVLVKWVVFTCLRDILLQSVAYVAVKTLDVEVHVVLMELFKHFRFRKDICINTKECRNFIFLNMHEVLVWQVAKKNVAAVSSVICQAVENALFLLDRLMAICLAIIMIISILLVFHELIEAILFIVLVVFHVLLGIAIFMYKNSRVSNTWLGNKVKMSSERFLLFQLFHIVKFGLNLLFCAVALVFILINLVNVQVSTC